MGPKTHLSWHSWCELFFRVIGVIYQNFNGLFFLFPRQAIKCMQAWVQFGVPMEEMGALFERLVSNVQVKVRNVQQRFVWGSTMVARIVEHLVEEKEMCELPCEAILNVHICNKLI